MNIRRMLVCECSFVGSVASRSFAFPVIFSRKRTNRQELCEIIRRQVVVEYGRDLANDIKSVACWIDSGRSLSLCLSFDRRN